MKRRSFTFGLAAASAAPALPLSTTIAPAATGPAQHFTLASLLARAHNHCTPDLLARHLKVSVDMAQQVQALLVQRGVITAPIAGASMAVQPLNTYCTTNEALKTSNYLQKATDLRARLKDVADRLDTSGAPEDEDLCTRL